MIVRPATAGGGALGGAPAAKAPSPPRRRAVEEVTLSIVVCTYQRPTLLEGCLHSCLQQSVPANTAYEIIVIDNDPAGAALPVVTALGLASEPRLRYVQEPVANIASARNRGVEEARGELIAFIDDDFVVPEAWLSTVVRLMQDDRIDVLLGDVRPIFEGGGATRGVTRAFTRHAPEVNGVVQVGRDGYTPGARSGNAVLRRKTCFADGQVRFDPTFGRSGGEDSEFFMRLGRRRPRIIASAEAYVLDFVPIERQFEAYVVRRACREGRSYRRLMRKNAPRPRLKAADLAVRGLLQAARTTLLLAAAPGLSPERRLDLRIRRGLALGKAGLAGAPRPGPYR
ncbi:MAG: glycosyltransferase family 2 protein [Rhodospirillales bacterium]